MKSVLESKVVETLDVLIIDMVKDLLALPAGGDEAEVAQDTQLV